MKNHCFLIVTIVQALLFARPAFGQDRYYLMVFSFQKVWNLPRHSHSFAAFVKVPFAGNQRVNEPVEAFSISWLPRELDVNALRLCPESGVNLDLHTTLRLASERNVRVSMWGPVQIQPELYQSALRQKHHLESGTIGYKAIDSGYSPNEAVNCIHAIGDVAVGVPRIQVGMHGWGDRASYFIFEHFKPWIIDPIHVHDWVGNCLGLGGYPICHRDLTIVPPRMLGF
jgi:hypothetical protein